MDITISLALAGEAEGKSTKKEANYRPESAEDEECSGCVHYFASNGIGSCELVAGTIDPEYVCDWFEPVGKSKDTSPRRRGIRGDVHG